MDDGCGVPDARGLNENITATILHLFLGVERRGRGPVTSSVPGGGRGAAAAGRREKVEGKIEAPKTKTSSQ